MAVLEVKLEEIQENKYNPRSHYDAAHTKELASSIEQIGLLEIPKARLKADGTYELAYGGYRLRAFKMLAQKDADKWGKMPLDIVEILDATMPLLGIEENLKRHDMTPMDTAFAIARALSEFPETKEDDIATRLSMSQGTISNMVRVTKLPKEVLKYIDDETINFTMGRELCSIIDIDAATKGGVEGKLVMIEAIGYIGTEGYPSTVTGIRKAIHKAVKNKILESKFREVTDQSATAFNPAETGCYKCPTSLKTVDLNGKPSYTCLNPTCWDLNQSAAKRKAAEAIAEAEAKAKADAEAKAKALAEVTAATEAAEAKRKAEEEDQAKQKAEWDAAHPEEKNISQEIKPEPPAGGEPVPAKQSQRVINVNPDRLEENGDIDLSYSPLLILTGKEVAPPFHELGDDYLSVGDNENIPNAKEAYRISPRGEFTGTIRALKSMDEMAAMSNDDRAAYRAGLKADPMGPFHGVVVTREGKEYVMVGPPVVFAPSAEAAAKPVPPKTMKKKEVPDASKKSPVAAPSAGGTPEVPTAGNAAESEETNEGEETGTEYSVTLTLSVFLEDETMSEEDIDQKAQEKFLGLVAKGKYEAENFEIEKQD